MKEVTKEEFYNYVNPRDICIYCVKTEPISVTHFKTRGGQLIGIGEHDYYNEKKTYYLKEGLLNE